MPLECHQPSTGSSAPNLWRRRVGRDALPEECRGSTPEPPSCWENPGGVRNALLPSFPPQMPSKLEVREPWGAAAPASGALEKRWDCAARSFSLENSVLLLRQGLSGNSSRESQRGVGASGALGIWEGMEEHLGCPKSSALLWDWRCTTSPAPRHHFGVEKLNFPRAGAHWGLRSGCGGGGTRDGRRGSSFKPRMSKFFHGNTSPDP